MSAAEAQAEPTMEEILASIRRIISEEEEAGAPAHEPVLELASPEPGPEPVIEPEPAPVAAAKPAPRPSQEVDDLMVFEDSPAPAETELLSDSARAAAAGAFGRLAGALRVAEAPGQTLEGMVREMLRPMLKEWLDAHLPAIVEAAVESELNRIARLGR